jgi:acetyl esterase/lipase
LSSSASLCALTIPSLTAPPSSSSRGVSPPSLSSRLYFSSDYLLSQYCQMLIAHTYLSNGGNPVKDYCISPLRVPNHLLATFPPTYIHVGSSDPLVDDSVLFIQKLISVNKNCRTKFHVFDGISHGYLHMLSLLREAHEAVKLSIDYIEDLFRSHS